MLAQVKTLHFQDSLNFEFAGNPWDCGCDTLQRFKVTLQLKYLVVALKGLMMRTFFVELYLRIRSLDEGL